MKTLIIFLFFNLIGLTVYCQTGEIFNYECSSGFCSITLKAEKPVSKNAIFVGWRPVKFGYTDTLLHAYSAIVLKSIHPEKMQKLLMQTNFRVILQFDFSISGKVLTINMYLPKISLNILDEDDLYILYNNLRNFEMDMTKIDIIYSPFWIQGTDAFWGFHFSVPIPIRERKSNLPIL